MAGVEVLVQSQLLNLVQDLEKIQKSSQELTNTLKATGEEVGKVIDNQTKKQLTGLEKLKQSGRSVANQLTKDFTALASLGGLTGGLSLAGQFKGSVSEALNLSDTVRRLGHVFGIAKSDFASFQSALQKGFGDIGLSSEAAANAMQGLSETPVRGQENIMNYAKTSGQLAAISGEKGNEGQVAKGLVNTIQSRGGNVQNPEELARASREVLQIQTATGKKATEVTAALADLYSHTNADFKKSMSGGGAVTLATAALKGGPGATSFLESFMSLTKFQRAGMESQGLGKLIGSNGQLDPKAFAATMAEANRRSPGNAEFGLTTMGVQSGDEAKGFMRLAEVLQRPEEAREINGAGSKKVDLAQTFDETMGAADNFSASLNKVKGEFSDFISTLTQGGTDLLGAAKKTSGGAEAVVGGGALISAIATGLGIKGLVGALGLGSGTAAAGGAASAAGGAAATAGGIGLGPAMLAIGAGRAASHAFEYAAGGGLESAVRDLITALTDKYTKNSEPNPTHNGGDVRHHVIVTPTTRAFRATVMPPRGGSQ